MTDSYMRFLESKIKAEKEKEEFDENDFKDLAKAFFGVDVEIAAIKKDGEVIYQNEKKD